MNKIKEPTVDDMKDFLDQIAVVKETEIAGSETKSYYSKLDGSYITHVGMEDHKLFLLEMGITEQIQNGTDHNVANIGFNPQEQKWYGWSHRAIYGFGIGSECKKGHAHYRPAGKEEWIEATKKFWDDPHHLNVYAEETTNDDGQSGIEISWTYDNKVSNKKLRGTISSVFQPFPDEFGKGEWVAETMEDAKQMACDFARGVS